MGLSVQFYTVMSGEKQHLVEVSDSGRLAHRCGRPCWLWSASCTDGWRSVR